ncbi:DUF6869 domain-containing protein [Lysobacter hankyongensis]|uniref:DUF6869 domain-containing protein n=1 Tax=Lysobacter hankyongensis TaxID=1176535 RepID=A0ABP9AHC1_9GAMM
MAWPFDNESQLDEWVERFIERHKERPPEDPEDIDACLQAQSNAETEAPSADEIEALLSDPDLFAIHHGHEEAVWRFILKVIARHPPEWTLEMLAVGPLEDLIALRGVAFIDRIESEARENHLFREILLDVWQNRTPPDIWVRVERARGTITSSGT